VRWGLSLVFVRPPDGEVLAGKLPRKKDKLVVAWIEIHQDNLLANWQLAVNGKKAFKIRGLDQRISLRLFQKTILHFTLNLRMEERGCLT
jgi:hypothetical protein